MADEQSHPGITDIVKIIITGLLSALIFGPLGVGIGYIINNYLAKDNIKIEHVGFFPETDYFHLSQEDYDNLLRNTHITSYIASNFSFNNLLSKAVHGESLFDPVGSSKIQKGLDKEQVNTFINFIDGFAKLKIYMDGRTDEFIKRLETYKNGDNITDIFFEVRDSGISNDCLNNPAQAVPMLLEYFKIRKKSHPNENEIISHVRNALKDFKQSRTGLMKINAAFLNLGNTDGLVSRSGILYLINEKKRIEIKMSDMNRIPKVEKRSMLQISFEIDKDQSKPEDVSVLNSLLINYSSSQASIEVYDIRNKPIRSENFSLPVRRATQ